MSHDFCNDITSRLSAEGEIDISSLKNTDADFHNVDINGILLTGVGTTALVEVCCNWNKGKFVPINLETGVIHEMRIQKIRNNNMTATKVVVFGSGR